MQYAPSPYAPPGYVPPPPQFAPTHVQGGMPPYGYPPPPPPPHGLPYGGQYVMMPVQNHAPSKRWAMVGGIMDIVTSSIYLLLGLIAFAAASSEPAGDKGSVMMGLFIFNGLAVLGIIFGVYAIRGRWGGALGGGILHSVSALFCFGVIGLVQEEKERRDRLYGYDDYYYESSRDKEYEAIAGVLVLFALLSVLTAIFNYIGISGAKARQRYEQHMRATETF